MATEHSTPPRSVTSHVHVPPVVHHPSPTVKRGQVVATRSGSTAAAPHESVYAPWEKLLSQADARLKTEITAALRELEGETAEAGQILDRAYSMAAESAGALEHAAWAAYEKYMAAADDTRSAILTPATAHYDSLIAAATARYNKALDDARRTYNSIVNDVNKAKSDAKLSAA